MGQAPEVALVAGEASGDVLAGLLLGGLRSRWPDLVAHGIGGPQMVRQGFEAWWPHHSLTVHGFSWELLRRYREIVGIRRQLRERLLLQRPDVFIGVDAPDFNLDLEASLKAAGVKTVHFVSPSVWAWRAERLEKMHRSADLVLCIFPFEPALLARHGIAATYVGHPIAGTIALVPDRGAARAKLGLGDADTVVALLPGSRSGEIAHLGLRFFQAAGHIAAVQPDVKFVLPAAPGLQERIAALAQQSGMAQRVQIFAGQSHTALAACDVSLIASGTATLEAALFKRPMVIAYHMGWLSWQLMRRKRLQPWVGLPNILCREFVVPELLQDAATPEAMAKEVLNWLHARSAAPEKIEALTEKFTLLHQSLQRDTAKLATDAIENLLQG
ncbi:MAG: lipid-A-disaccharide synthase [Rhodoferax sp.]|nr:lipid-A-disaccharide synthase [Rhodoferax sp.]